MSGLCDVTTGLKEGTGLQFQTQIGTSDLVIKTGTVLPAGTGVAWDNSDRIMWDDGNHMTWA